MTLRSPLIGHLPQKEQLLRDTEMQNVAHAYLFEGPAHIGKFTVAKWFAEVLLTVDTDEEHRESMRHQIQRLIHPDLLVIDWLWMDGVHDDLDTLAKHSNIPQDHRRKAKAKTDTIGIDDIRAVQDRLNDVGSGRYRCCLIRSAERMQDEAVNALLKLLEEPPEGVVFLLTAESQSALLPTLVSRMRLLRFSRVSDREMEAIVGDMPEEEQRFLLDLAQGAPGIALRLKQDPDLLRKEHQMHLQSVSFWRSASLQERLQLLAPLQNRTEEANRFLLHLSLALRRSVPAYSKKSVSSLMALLRGLDTNASRPLLLQRFAMTAFDGGNRE